MLNKEQAIRYGKQIGVRYHIYNNYGCLMGGTKTREQAVEMKRRFEMEDRRKPCTLDDVRTGAAQIERRHGGAALDSYYVAEEIQLEENAFFELLENLLADRDWCWEFSNRLYPMRNGAVPAIRVSCRGSLTVLIIDPQGFDYPRYVGLERL